VPTHCPASNNAPDLTGTSAATMTAAADR
jgi:hypothetical protein